MRQRKEWFADEYYKAAAVGAMYRQGYSNRAYNTYNYLVTHEIAWELVDA